MTLSDLLTARPSTRALDPGPLAPDDPLALVDAARWTPSCRNQQPWRFHAVLSADALEAARATLAPGNRAWAGRAPLLLVATARAADDCRLDDGREYALFDLGMAVMNVMHAATERGLVCRPLAGFEPVALAAALGLPADAQVPVVLAIGRPGDPSDLPPDVVARGAGPRFRKPLSELVTIH
jgi:nitroreductase